MNSYQELYSINRLTDAEASATEAAVSAAGNVVSQTISTIFSAAGDAASGGAGAIAQAIAGVVDSISGAVTDVMLGVQEAVTNRRQITADEMKSLLDTKTTEWTNLPFYVIGAVVMVLLLYIKSKK